MKKILILASNPRKDLNLDREIRDLKKVVERSRNQEQFDVEIELAVPLEDLQELFLQYQPCIVHFCGHGTGDKGLVLENKAGKEQIVSTQALSGLFKIFRNDVQCVLLNACYTEIQADAIVEHIQYAIGTSREILDEAAYFFAVGFYRGLGYGKSIEQCYELGCNAIELQMPNVTIRQDVSERYRKFKVIAENESVSEPLKIVLKKNSLLLSPSPKTNSGNSVSVEIPSEFIEAINEEGKRKKYNNITRKTLDEFGQTNLDRRQPVNQHEYRQQKILLNKVKDFWIEGFLKPSLYADTIINLELKKRHNAVKRPFAEIEELPVELDRSFEKLQQTDIFNQIGQGKTLLILGEPGSGKTIALLQLAQRLIEKTENNLSQLIPIVLNLSSWAKKQQKIEEWLIEELREKYQVSKSLSQPWIEQEKLILLLDGLDEVKIEYRNNCVRALNNFITNHGITEIVVCSRVKDYEALKQKLKLSSAICIEPLSSEQVHSFLAKAGDSLIGLKTLLQQDNELENFAQTPLILNIMSLAYQGVQIEDLLPQFRSTKDRYYKLWNAYIERMLNRKKTSAKYPKEKVLPWLSWLAERMVQESQTVFSIENMQPTWLDSRSEIIAYQTRNFLFSWLIFGLIFGLIYGLSVELKFGFIYGFIFALIVGLILGFSKKIVIIDRIVFSILFCV